MLNRPSHETRRQDRNRHPRQANAEEPSEHGEQQTFGCELPHETPAPCAKRGSRGQLRQPRGASRQQQVRHVHRRDEQHHADDGQDDEERSAEGPAQLVEALRAGRRANREISRRRLRLTLSGRRLRVSGQRLLKERRELRLGLRDLHTRGQAAHHAGEKRHPAACEQLAIRQRSQGKPDIRREAGLMALERRRRDADDRARAVPDSQRSADSGRTLLFSCVVEMWKSDLWISTFPHAVVL
jgi:hypothetical protein